MRVTLNELKDSMEKAIANQEFILAQTLKLEADRVTAEQIKLHDEIQQEKALTIVEDVRAKSVICWFYLDIGYCPTLSPFTKSSFRRF